MTDLEFHPASLLFPLMDGIELAALVEDIRAHGLLEPIVMHEERILDGRNRLRACEAAGVESRFVEWAAEGMTPTEWIVSVNLHRRHLTTGQRAALALDLLPRLQEEAHERQRGGQGGILLSPETDEASGRADEKAADLVGLGRSTVANAKAIQKRDETGEIVERMRSGELNVAQAARAAGYDKRGQSGDRGGAMLDDGTRDALGRAHPVYYGSGDKFDEAMTPATRYLRAWRRKEFRYAHVNYKEARKRLQVLDSLVADIEGARADLVTRADPAKLRV